VNGPTRHSKGFEDDDRCLQGADDIPALQYDSFWNYRATCELTGARYPAAAAWPDYRRRAAPGILGGRNTETLTEADFEWADLVMTGGMLFQQPDTLSIIDMCRARCRPLTASTTSAGRCDRRGFHRYIRVFLAGAGFAEVTVERAHPTIIGGSPEKKRSRRS
jgi:hypothetical protein